MKTTFPTEYYNEGFSEDCKILQKPAFQCLGCLFAERNRTLSVPFIEMSEENISYLASAYLFITAFSSSVPARLKRVTTRDPSSPSTALHFQCVAFRA